MLLGIIQNDASLMPCRLRQLRETVDLSVAGIPDAVGAGFVQNSHALVRRRPGSLDIARDPLALVEDVQASGVIVHLRRATVGGFKDENTHPFRYGSWLFAHTGTVAGFGDLRPRLLDSLPPFLRRGISGETDSEHVFAVFLAQLKELGVLELANPGAEHLARAMARTNQAVEAWATEVGAGGQSTMDLVATNGRAIVASRRGEPALSWAVLEGMRSCPLHDLAPGAPETHPMRVPHYNLRSVVVTTGPRRDGDALWQTLDEGGILAAGRDLNVQLGHVTD